MMSLRADRSRVIDKLGCEVISKGRHFLDKIILWAVRWYCKYGVSYRDLEEMMEERGVDLDHTTVYRWVQPLVMASEVGGLDPLHGYLKHGNLVLRMRFPYLELANNVEKFVERKVTTAVVKPTVQPVPVEVKVREPVMPRKTTQKKREQKPAEVNEQHPYLE